MPSEKQYLAVTLESLIGDIKTFNCHTQAEARRVIYGYGQKGYELQSVIRIHEVDVTEHFQNGDKIVGV